MHLVLPEKNDAPLILDNVLAIWGQGLGQTRHWCTAEEENKPLLAGWGGKGLRLAFLLTCSPHRPCLLPAFELPSPGSGSHPALLHNV